ncbi:AMP-binding protein [Streptomyces sp. NPDC048484]|uniref:AMP-binding protein n=1 Tax=Streptomyces sp. NPDC048484 TaxID=3155146 RepID=UPI00343496A8
MASNREVSVGEHSTDDFLHGFMLAAVRSAPDRPAVIEPNGDDELSTVSYGELERMVRENAAALDALGLDVGDRVILESSTSAAAIAMLLACSSLGLPFIPVSPETPEKRLLSIIETAEPALHLQTADGRRDGIPERVATARFGPRGLEVERPPASRVRHRRAPVATDPAYIIFTSGTTGRAKGVVMSHRAVTAFFRGILHHGLITAEDRVATTSPLQFDFSLFDIGFALGSGAAVVPVPRDWLGWPRRFLKFLNDAGVTQVDGVPSIWRPVMRHEPELLAGLDGLHGILFSGEDFPLRELRRLQSLLPKVRFVNGYGATESMACSVTDVPNPIPEDVEKLSIGFAHPGAEMTIIDDQGRPIEEPGRVGEIYLRSPALFTGYWGDPEATAAALVPDPLNRLSGQIVFRTGDLAHRGADGELYFRGRVDSQVQILGNRVELGEVERRLTELPGVVAAAAQLLPRPGREPELNAFVVIGSTATPFDKAGARAFCAETLPAYMLPKGLYVLDELPVTENGKVDRAALAAHAAVSAL